MFTKELGRKYCKNIEKLSPQDQNNLLDILEKNPDIRFKDAKKKLKKNKKDYKGISLSDISYQLLHSDFRIIEDSFVEQYGQVDYIITDPPYPKEFLSLYSDLSRFSKKVLKQGGLLICMVGQSYFPEVINRLSENLTYHWTHAYLTPGGQATQLWQRKVNTFWKPLLCFSNGKYNGDWVGDVCKSPVNQNDKRFHCWGQSVAGMVDIIERFTYPREIVLDPFVGGGTTGLACLLLRRNFIGIDINIECIDTSSKRLEEFTKNQDKLGNDGDKELKNEDVKIFEI
jgi:site-specific DNA-methyltransferase (adenine-specific)